MYKLTQVNVHLASNAAGHKLMTANGKMDTLPQKELPVKQVVRILDIGTDEMNKPASAQHEAPSQTNLRCWSTSVCLVISKCTDKETKKCSSYLYRAESIRSVAVISGIQEAHVLWNCIVKL
jgi:hypothetical protein